MVESVDTIAILERAHSLANEAMFTVALQCRRIKTVEPEDETFIFRWWVDFQFLILALCRLRRAVKIAHKVLAITGDVKIALHKFDRALPHLIRLRNVGELIDEYVVDSESRHVSVFQSNPHSCFNSTRNPRPHNLAQLTFSSSSTCQVIRTTFPGSPTSSNSHLYATLFLNR